MRLQEYQGKELFRRVGISVSEGQIATTPQEAEEIARTLGGAVVVKAQVLVGGRGKAGGVKLAQTPAEARAHAEKILQMSIKGERVRKVLITRAVEIEREFYLSITIDRSAKQPVVIFSAEGGIEIEELAKTHPEKIIKFHIHPLVGLQGYQVRTALFQAKLDPKWMTPLSEIFFKLYEAFTRYRAHLVEINPLALTRDGRWLAVDAKVMIDDDDVPSELAGWEAEELASSSEERAAREADLQYVKLDGSIGIIGNGAGLVMSTLDLVALNGGRPANFLDIGGGANAEVMKQALKIVLSDSQVRGLFINIFGGITRCDEVARGLVATQQELGIRVPMVVRLTGTNEIEGRRILQEHGITPVAGMEEGAAEIVRRVSHNI
ncbi:MAG: ADP-forming succinate--CoA ligase subunit beta [Candidatus Bipolaricaulota bacterium]|nr:ADP-forming succinate--CoA ligase subunit beta [Candidatus Bipolaricaulota bacterium]MCS7275013.1 ADP-forming succinate--CoA ligase subunit beta [Candidatus Bipolaricaulota bacterium]MDW8110522.1 ADP-forming succinate--CoA ligase subunit beta [Candidatus Bipolaricaulota bacterium]MDW8329327.1 ADP-forming succinate--CoA ligase subunit beta [Candidatus Bipolaricaulota bacterium]